MTVVDHTTARAGLVKSLARSLGFDLVGVAPAEPSAYGAAYRAWVAAGKHGAMEYLARNVEERLDIRLKYPWAKSLVCVGVSYYAGEKQEAGSKAQEDGPVGKVARYAWGRDYHRLIGHRLEKLEALMREQIPEAFKARTYTDTGPILEREAAARAGLGWIGKHTLLIHPQHGSWFLLGELVTSLELEPDSPIGPHCGTCTRCIEACPTGAITDHSVDATRCISYQTLEFRGEAPAELKGPTAAAGFLVGCDICQEVCPFNRKPLPTREVDFAPRPPAPAVPLREVLSWDEQQWDIMTRGRAHRRARFAMWQRNARVLLEGDGEGGRAQ